MSAFTHQVRVRYSEVDNQGVVYNSRYLEYIDHAFTMWMRHHGIIYESLRHGSWDVVLRHAEVDWLGGAQADEVVDVIVQPVRAGTSSFELLFDVARHDGTVLFRARVVYVGIDPNTGEKAPLPDLVRGAVTG